MKITELTDLNDVDVLVEIASTYPKTHEESIGLKKQLLKELSEAGDNRLIFVGYQNDQAVAMIQMILKNADNDPELADGNKIVHLHNLQVRSELQNQGIGKEMMAFTEDKARELNKKIITLGVDNTNAKAIHLYEKLGYQIFKIEPGRTPDEKGLLMKKELI